MLEDQSGRSSLFSCVVFLLAMGNCLPVLFRMSRNLSTHDASERFGNQNNPKAPIFSMLSPYVNQLYAANVARQRAAAEENKTREDAQRQRVKGLLDQIPADEFRSDMKGSECAICMVDFEPGERVRFLPCMHSFHQTCVDDWLMRSFTCPSCLEPVDSTILSSLTAHTQQSLQELACSPATHGMPFTS
ncbi:zinc finger, C3HC4 type [Ancylostoma ceylanicum]|uniref:Zinc finger, C3HC4 type n=1 Tax=Ancylostoma ceylanicum TaxID=53326 RepID=A0A0D6LNY0_9BILA|nr:zinc finger, C3HC4 type [Ancylostoma ceylanicum]